MPTYHYRCAKGCKFDDLKKQTGKKNTIKNTIVAVKSGDLVWEERHRMLLDPPIKCPLCNGEAIKTLEGIGAPVSYIRGYGYLDRKGCQRDMDLYKLDKGEDPYASLRQPGEVDEIKNNLRKPKKKRQYYT